MKNLQLLPNAGLLCILLLTLAFCTSNFAQAFEQKRARELGIAPGILATGPDNTITDVDGVLVGQVTLSDGKTINTGATAILPHAGNLYQAKVPAAVVIGNGFGKMMGISQIMELGEIETPIVLVNTLAVANAANGIISWTLAQKGNEQLVSINAIVGETNDSGLNDVRARALKPEHVVKAIESAKSGPVAEGAVGAGRGTRAFGWKGGIGTSSRHLPKQLGGYMVGVLVQTNFGGILKVNGVAVGEKLGQYYLKNQLDEGDADGSIMIVVATNAPLSDRNLRRLADRALTGLARTGSTMSNGSGDYVIAFSTANSVRRTKARRNGVAKIETLSNDNMSPLFLAAIEATEEAIYNSLFMANDVSSIDPVSGKKKTMHSLPLDELRALIKD